jgi:hypothetical protein
MSSKTDLRSLIDSVSRSIESVYVQEDSVRTSKEMEIKTSPEEDWFSVVQHESGHFLVGYLLGVLPRHYEIPTLEAVRQNVSNVTGRVEFVGFEFLKQVSSLLNKWSALCMFPTTRVLCYHRRSVLQTSL